MISKKRMGMYIMLTIVLTSLAVMILMVSTIYIRGGIIVMSDDYYQMLEGSERVAQVVDIVSDKFYQPKEQQEVVDSAINGIIASLNDPYAAYFTEEDFQTYIDNMNGELSGIGLLMAQNEAGEFEVIKVYNDTPAQRAELMQGDILAEVDGQKLEGLTVSEVAKLVQGDEGSAVTLTIRRNAETFEKILTREHISMPRVSWRMLNDEVGYIRIDVFSGDCVSGFSQALEELKSSGAGRLVIDVRDNPGGNLDDVVAICDMLLGDCTIVSTQDRGEEATVYKSDAESAGLPIALLVNSGSASASEIMAAAIKDNNAGVIVGKTTYGKGVVQSIITLANGDGRLKITTSEYYTPSGVCIQDIGVTPNIEVGSNKETDSILYEDRTIANDAQLAAAVNAIKK